jgi:hypothetical protein
VQAQILIRAVALRVKVAVQELPEMYRVTLKMLRLEERDKRLVIKEAQMVS